MRNVPFALAALVFLLFAGNAQGQAQALKIGYLNSQEVLNSAPGAEEAQVQFDREMQDFQREIQQLEEEIRGMEQQYQQQQLTLSPEAKANRERQIQLKIQEYEQRGTELQERAAQRRAELVQPMMDRITEVIEQIREEQSYSLILDVAAGSIVSADPALDITAEVLQRLQAQEETSLPGDGGR